MIRATGWTVVEYLDQPVSDIFDLVEHLNEEPPAYRILAWRYLKPQPRKLSGRQIEEQHAELCGELGARAQKLPDHLKQMVLWAEEQQAKLNPNRKTN